MNRFVIKSINSIPAATQSATRPIIFFMGILLSMPFIYYMQQIVICSLPGTQYPPPHRPPSFLLSAL